MYSDIAQHGNRENRDPKLQNLSPMSAIIHENKVVKSKKGKMALRTEILQTHREALNFRDAKFVATIWLKPSKIQFFNLFPINIRVFTLYPQQMGHTGINETIQSAVSNIVLSPNQPLINVMNKPIRIQIGCLLFFLGNLFH